MNGYEKKLLFILTIEALLHNPKANLEFHLHHIVSILVNFLISPNVSSNQTDFEITFREKSAFVLAKIVNKFF